jgi:hypothetical protein
MMTELTASAAPPPHPTRMLSAIETGNGSYLQDIHTLNESPSEKTIERLGFATPYRSTTGDQKVDEDDRSASKRLVGYQSV